MTIPPFLDFVLVVTVLCPTVLAQPASAERTALQAEAAIESAYLRADTAALAAAISPLDAALAAAPDDPALLYTRAFADYAAAELSRGPGREAARRQSFDDAVQRLARVQRAPWAAEADALRATILGVLIALQSDIATAGATLGPESARLLAQAVAAAPTSPRILMFRGRMLLFMPRDFGGDPAQGADLLQQAVDRYTSGTLSADGPRWGYAEALAYLGFARQQAGDPAAARVAWQQALRAQPDYAWVKSRLLPSLDRQPGHP